MSREKQLIKMPFPPRGIDVNNQKIAQPPGTAIDLQNVRVTDRIETRARGGQRQGLLKYTANAAVANTRIQDIGYTVFVNNTAPVPGSVNVRNTVLTAVCNGNVYTFNTAGFTLATGGSAALTNTAPVIFSSDLYGITYFADGVNEKKFTATNSTVNTWTPTAGTLPSGGTGIKSRLITAWRGRIVLSGLRTDPHNWFMSKLGDPLNWDYAPVAVTEIIACQGGVGYVGKLGDIINCLIPYNDDVLIVGCDKSLWQMAGDPMAGGKIDMISDSAGAAFGRPFCRDSRGNMYFFGTQARIYKIEWGGKPEIVSEPINNLLANTNLNTTIVRMVYDNDQNGFHVFFTPLTPGNTTHWFYDDMTQGWFKNVLGNSNCNPVSCVRYIGDDARYTLIGSEDGFVRYFANNTYADDGTNTTSYVIFGPFMSENAEYPHIMTEIQGILDASSSSILYEVLSGNSPDAALASVSGTFTGEGTLNNGRSYAFQPRERSYYTYVKVGVTTNSSWAIEEIMGRLSIITSSRGRNL
jgi:hypothetical protein